MKISLKLKIFYFFNFLNLLYVNQKFNKEKKALNVCLCTLGKNENRYIREFVIYYYNYLIDKIFLYDNNDIDGERFENVIKDFIDKGFVKLINRRGIKKDQLEILNHCYKSHYQKYDWLIFYDIDEYIHLNNYTNIKDFLNEEKFNNCEVIHLNWIIHTDNNLIYYDNRTLHERFPILEPNARKKKKYYSPVKSILKGHIPNIKIDCLHRLNSQLNYCNGFGVKPKIISYVMQSDLYYYYIDHFYFKSLEEFTEKLNRGSARSYNSKNMKLFKLKRYFLMNDINIFKYNFILNKTGLKLELFKKNHNI